ncbi:MAG: NADAR family protein [Candidatus Paceibacterota bacterium]|jgi:hypothetical protein
MERITDKYVFFWNGEFSNWFECKFPFIKYKGLTFFNSEQAFMWEKAIFFGDMEIAKKIVETPNPKENKILGRKVKNFDKNKWLREGYEIMIAVNLAKFGQNSRLKAILLSTEDKIIVEASPYDTIWGIGLHWEDDRVLDEKNWRGMNLLGKALMEVREKLGGQ